MGIFDRFRRKSEKQDAPTNAPDDSGNELTAAAMLTELIESAPDYPHNLDPIEELNVFKRIMDSSAEVQKAVLLLAVDEIGTMRDRLGRPHEDWDHRYANLHQEKGFPLGALAAAKRLFRKKLPLTDADYVFLLKRTADLEWVSMYTLPYLANFLTQVEKYVQQHGLSDALDRELARFHDAIRKGNAPETKLRDRIKRLRKGPVSIPIHPGEAWSDAALADLDAMTDDERAGWTNLIDHCTKASGGTPSAKWRKAAAMLIDAIGREAFRERMLRWLPLIDKPRTAPVARRHADAPDPNHMIIEPHADVIKGFVWMLGQTDDRDVARMLTSLALSAYRKLPGLGPRAVKIGNACVCALGAMPGMDAVGQLALLQVKVRFRTAQKGIEKSLNATAERLGIPTEELIEMGVPAYGLTEVGRMVEPMGEYSAELVVTGTAATELQWIKPDGKTQKSVPASVKRDFADELKEVNSAAKDIQKMLPAQRDRIDRLFLRKKAWPVAAWRERYLDHPLVGTLARRIIWCFASGGRTQAGAWLNDGLVDANDRPLTIAEDATVSLWHPIDRSIDEVMSWREWLERHEVRQPFKQAHREVYLLTDAERQTEVYSNRFAAHIVRQHQFNALCAVRGWKNTLKLLVDQDFPDPSIDVPEWNVRAEFWTQGAGEEYGVDTNEIGTFHFLSTDQLRFVHASGRPIPLTEVPPLVFSEVMRDVDLFVGVASVGNDPTWEDGGPQGRYREYWHTYSFGELTASARTRKDVLQRLIPRLKIADRCSFEDRFLIVRGDLRTYRIHLGSGNILMSPEDRYLCIVPGRDASERIFLPFEGDSILSIILSKAFMLAEDTKITDKTIVSQIRS